MKNDSFIENQKSNYKDYVSKLEIIDNVKLLLSDEGFINSNPLFYLYYPKLFATPFYVKNINNLCIAGYLYYQSTLFLDDIIDDNKKDKIISVMISQEESVKLLTNIFGLDSPFWNLWNNRRKEYFKAVKIEEKLKQEKNADFGEYKILAGYKSSFGKSAIDAVFILSEGNNYDTYNSLLKSHDYFSVAFQLNDDIQDFKKDFEKGQFNWAYYLMKKNNDINSDISTLNKLLYIKGYAKKIFLKAIKYLDKALLEIESIKVPLWLDILITTKKQFESSIIEIDNYLELLNADVSLSKTIIKNNSLSKSIAKAKQYIISQQKTDGSWHEYVNQGGISSTWSTAYIVSTISETELSCFFKEEIKKALSFLIKSKKDNLWGYNATWISDSDTSNFVFLAFLFNDINIPKSSLKEWFKFQKDDGSFSTYKDKKYLLNSLNDKNIKNVKGWVSTHHCVSAVSLFVLLQIKTKTLGVKKAITYFEKQNLDKITSYWWTSPIYTFYYLAKSYLLLGKEKQLKVIILELKKHQNKDGSFSDKYGVNLFYTGLALEVYLLDDIDFNNEVNMTSKYLLNNQFDNGSWKNSNALQVPDSSDIIPKHLKYPISKKGMNVRAKEFNRLFTTTTILKSLTLYEKRTTSPKNF